MALQLNEREKACVRLLAGIFEQGKALVRDPSEVMTKLGVDQSVYESLMATMAEFGFITAVGESNARYARHFMISPNVVQASRHLEQQEKESQTPKDIVDQMKGFVRSKPWTAWPIIVILALTVLLTCVNQLLQLLKNVGLLKGE